MTAHSDSMTAYILPARLARRLGASAVYLERRVLAFLFFGFASGLPLGLIGETYRIRLTDAGIDFGAIGMTSLIGTAYSIKFLWSPLVDHLSPGPLFARLGMRRGWMALTLLAMMLLLLPLALIDPTRALVLSVLCAVAIAFLSATFDIVVDAYRIEYLSDRQLAGGTAIHATGWYLGAKLAAGVLALWLADSLGWQAAYLLTGLTLSIGLIVTLLGAEPVRDRESEAQARQDEAKTYLAARTRIAGRRARLAARLYVMIGAPFRDLLHRFGPGIFVIIAFVILFKFQDAFAGAISGPFVRAIGYEKTTIAFVYKGAGFGAILLGMLAAGLLANWLGLVRALWIGGSLQVVSNLGFAWLAAMTEGLAPAAVDARWDWLAFAIGFENFASGLGNALFVVFLSKLVSDAYTATQYALLSALALTARTWLAAPAGYLYEAIGAFDFFIVSAVAGLPGLVLLYLMIRKGRILAGNDRS